MGIISLPLLQFYPGALSLNSTDLPGCQVKGRTRGRRLCMYTCPLASGDAWRAQQTCLSHCCGRHCRKKGWLLGLSVAQWQHSRKAGPTGGENTGTRHEPGLGFPADTEPLLLRLLFLQDLVLLATEKEREKNQHPCEHPHRPSPLSSV